MEKNPLRRWLVLLFIGPGVFFIVYWIVVQGNTGVTPGRSPLPREYFSSGRTVQLTGYRIQAGLSGSTILRRDMVIENNNHVMAERGKIFLIIPVFSSVSPPGHDAFHVVDSTGQNYSPLGVGKAYLERAASLDQYQVPREMKKDWLLFKVKESVRGYYLFFEKDKEKAVWYFPRVTPQHE